MNSNPNQIPAIGDIRESACEIRHEAYGTIAFGDEVEVTNVRTAADGDVVITVQSFNNFGFAYISIATWNDCFDA